MAQSKRIVILGAGFGGLQTSAGLSEALGDGYEIVLIDKNDSFFIGFAKLDVLFGKRTESAVRYRYENLKADRVRFVQATIDAIDTKARTVATSAGQFDYDYLVVALGADLDIDATPGYRDSGGYEFYSMAGTVRLKPVIEEFSRGSLVLGVLKMPYKCPPAPYEAACQLHESFLARGVRDQIAMKMVIPGPRPVANPKVAAGLESLLAERDIELVSESPIQSIDAAGQKLVTASGEVGYDLFIGVPVHVPPAVVRASGLASKGFLLPSTENLETDTPNVYAIGDVSKIPVGDKAVPKAGAFAEDAAKTVVSDILVKEGLASERVTFTARGACYFEVKDETVARVSAVYLAGDRPQVTFDAPSKDLHPDKLEFENSRRDRWFKRA